MIKCLNEDGNFILFYFIYLFFKFILFLFIFLWLCWVFVSVRGLSLVVASGGHSSLQCAGLSLSRRLLLRSTSSRRAGSVIVAHGPSCSAACGIFPDSGSNPCPLHWQADSQPLRHQGSPGKFYIEVTASFQTINILILHKLPGQRPFQKVAFIFLKKITWLY